MRQNGFFDTAKRLQRWLNSANQKLIGLAEIFFMQRHTDAGFLLSAVVIGIAIGGVISLFHWIMILFEAMFHYLFEATDHIPIVRFFAFPLIAGLGGLAVGILNRSVFRQFGGEGIPSVTHAIHRRDGRISIVLSLKTMLTAALSISSGGGAGRESPTVLLGASLGSGIGQLLRLRAGQLRLLCAAGSAAAIGGIFNAPLGGIVFAVEVILGRLNLKSFIPVVVSSVMATATARLFVGNRPLLTEPPLAVITLKDFFFLAVAGIISGWVAIYFLRVFRLTRIGVGRLLEPVPLVWRPAIGGLGAGTLVAFLPTLLETTYDPINDAIAGKGVFWIAAATFLVKPISAAFTLGSGGEGGAFAPAMKAGAMFGFCLGYLLNLVFPDIPPGVYAMVCAAALISGAFYAPLTGAIILFEISRNYSMLLPLLFAAIFSAWIVHRRKIHTFNPNQRTIASETTILVSPGERSESDPTTSEAGS